VKESLFFLKLALPADRQEGNVIVLGRFANEGKDVRGDALNERVPLHRMK